MIARKKARGDRLASASHIIQQTQQTVLMKLLLVAIGASCRNELAAGFQIPSEDLRALAKSAGLQSKTLDGLRAEVKQKLEAALAEAFA